MGFTTAEETVNPDADVGRRMVVGRAVVIEKGVEVLAQLGGDDVLVELLLEHCLVGLVDFDDTVDGAVDVLLEHVLYLHGG